MSAFHDFYLWLLVEHILCYTHPEERCQAFSWTKKKQKKTVLVLFKINADPKAHTKYPLNIHICIFPNYFFFFFSFFLSIVAVAIKPSALKFCKSLTFFFYLFVWYMCCVRILTVFGSYLRISWRPSKTEKPSLTLATW